MNIRLKTYTSRKTVINIDNWSKITRLSSHNLKISVRIVKETGFTGHRISHLITPQECINGYKNNSKYYCEMMQ